VGWRERFNSEKLHELARSPVATEEIMPLVRAITVAGRVLPEVKQDYLIPDASSIIIPEVGEVPRDFVEDIIFAANTMIWSLIGDHGLLAEQLEMVWGGHCVARVVWLGARRKYTEDESLFILERYLARVASKYGL
jgi:hypothetical protein